MAIYRNFTEFRLFEETIEIIIQQYESQFLTPISVPIPIEMIVERLFNLQCEITYLDSFGEDVIGLLIPDQRRILVDSGCTETQHNFTIAHELGHWYLHYSHGSNEKFIDTSQIFFSILRSKNSKKSAKKKYREEIEANRFASALLIPRFHLKKYVRQIPTIGNKEIQLLASKFHTSPITMKIRLRELLNHEPNDHIWLNINLGSI